MSWFRSLNGVVTLSYLALLSLLLRSYADTAFILEEDFSDLGRGFVVAWIVGFTAIIGGWIWALAASAKGSRKSVYLLLVYAFTCATWFGVGSLIAFANFVEEIVLFGSSLILGIIAFISVWLHLRDRRHDITPDAADEAH